MLINFPGKIFITTLFLYVHRLRRIEKWKRANQDVAVDPSLAFSGSADFLKAVSVGRKSRIDRNVVFWLSDYPGALPRISVGERSYIGPGVYVGSHCGIEIGSDVMIGAYSYIISGGHCFGRSDVPMRLQGMSGAGISIGDDVWIGCHVVILPGVSIGKGAVIGAGAVVTRDVFAGEIVGGVPSKKIRARALENG